MVIGDELPTDKPKYHDRFGTAFEPVRERTFEWMKTQPLAAFAFYAGTLRGTPAMVVAPDNAGFFAYEDCHFSKKVKVRRRVTPPRRLRRSFARRRPANRRIAG